MCRSWVYRWLQLLKTHGLEAGTCAVDGSDNSLELQCPTAYKFTDLFYDDTKWQFRNFCYNACVIEETGIRLVWYLLNVPYSSQRYVQPTLSIYIQQGDVPETAVSTKWLSPCQSSLTTVTTVFCFKDSLRKCNLHWARYSMFVAIQKQSTVCTQIIRRLNFHSWRIV